MRVNKFFPWLKFAIPILIFLFVIVGIRSGIWRKQSEVAVVPMAPMSVQVKVPEKRFRDLRGKKLVALTFDDGPSKITTPQLLDILKEKNAVATFFELGRLVEANSEITRRAIQEGNEVGSHTYSHRNLIREKRGVVEDDKEDTDKVFLEVLGEIPALTRPPYGNYNDMVGEILGTPLILWSVDSRDWESKDTEKIIDVAVSQARDGSIILFHDIYQFTIDAIPEIIDRLREDDFEFVTVSELADERGGKMEAGEEYRSFYPD